MYPILDNYICRRVVEKYAHTTEKLKKEEPHYELFTHRNCCILSNSRWSFDKDNFINFMCCLIFFIRFYTRTTYAAAAAAAVQEMSVAVNISNCIRNTGIKLYFAWVQMQFVHRPHSDRQQLSSEKLFGCVPLFGLINLSNKYQN